MNPPRVLIIGYGNPDRQDDGVGYQALVRLAIALERPLSGAIYEDFQPEGRNPDLWFDLQLKPEMAEEISQYDQVFFIDAHTGAVPDDVNWKELSPIFQTSPLTHHLTPESTLSLCETLYGKKPSAILISIRGYEFGFSSALSEKTADYLSQAMTRILSWLDNHYIR
ncbi:MAG TPA: hydrogenase maturation protease [Longilinea sp.]|nr:hydrogenase maturation protease [Longilinea sp.]